MTSSNYYNIDDVAIDIGTNLPSMTDENINQQLALNGILSQKTLLSNLGYDYATEKKNKEEEAEAMMAMQPVNPEDPTAATPSEKTSTESTTDSQTNNQIDAKVNNKPKLIPDKTKNIKNVQSREGRPNK